MTRTSPTGDSRPVELLVDFPARPGLRDVTSRSTALAERSAAAVDAAMTSVRDVADRVSGAVSNMIDKPDEVEVEFGVKLYSELGALIAKTRVEAHLVVRLKWASGQGERDADSEAP